MKIEWMVDIGDEVACDFCNGDFTDSEKTGGLLLGSYAVCPDCVTPALLRDADSVAADGETFKAFVLRSRIDNTCGIATM